MKWSKKKKIVIFKSPIFMNSMEVSFKEESFHTHKKVYQKSKLWFLQCYVEISFSMFLNKLNLICTLILPFPSF